jgi:hypothetical protein
MVAPITASKKVANGKDTWWLVPTIVSQAAPTALEINSASGLNITGFVMAEQDGFTQTTNKVTLPRLLVELNTTQALDETVVDMPDIVGLFDPQAAAGANDKKFWAMVKGGFSGFIVRRQNFLNSASDAVTAGQFVDNAVFNCGPAAPGRSATDSSGVYIFTISATITSPVYNVAVV